MSILRANLKHLYQRRAVWLWDVILLCQMPLFLMPFFSAKHDRYLGYLIGSLFAGMLAGGLQKDVLTKPFAFCLPGHRKIPRAFIFLIGVVVNLILGCVFLGYPELSSPYVLLVVLAAGFVGMIFYFYGVYGSFQPVPTPILGMVGPLIVCAIIFKWDVILQNIIIHQPLVVILVSAPICVWVWKFLGRDFLARKYCGKLIMGAFDNWSRKKAEKYRQSLADKNLSEGKVKLFNKIHSFFLGKMNQCNFSSRSKYIWGNIYMVFGKFFGWWQSSSVLGFLVLIAFLLLVFGFAGPNNDDKRMIGILFIVPVLWMSVMDLKPYQTMLFPAGRKDKFYGILILSVVLTLLSGLLVLVIAGISVLLEAVLPEFSFRDWPILHYYGMDIGDFYIICLLMPVALSLSVTFQQTKAWLVFGFVMICMQAWIVSKIALDQSLPDIISPLGVAGLIVFCWIIFLLVLHYVCMRRALVNQGK